MKNNIRCLLLVLILIGIVMGAVVEASPNANSLVQYKVGTSNVRINNGTDYIGTGTARNITSNTTFILFNQTWDPSYVDVSNIRVNLSSANITGLTIFSSEIHNDKGYALINVTKASGFTSPANAAYDFNISFDRFAPNGTIAVFGFDASSQYYDPANATWWPFTYRNTANAILGAWPVNAMFIPAGPITRWYPAGVYFNDTSTGAIASVNWSFGDGTIANNTNSTYHQYPPRLGYYTVTENVCTAIVCSTNSTSVQIMKYP